MSYAIMFPTSLSCHSRWAEQGIQAVSDKLLADNVPPVKDTNSQTQDAQQIPSVINKPTHSYIIKKLQYMED
jgi:hypothetical protein